ncbi:MAG: hypothetical protein Q9216_000534 [Gyalolechia sp. 2 TL-2023]
MQPSAALISLLCHLENLHAQFERVRQDIKIAKFNIGFLPLILRPRLLPGWENKQVGSIRRELVVKEQINICRKAMVPYVAYIANGKGLPNELVDMIQDFIGDEDPVMACGDDTKGPMTAAYTSNKKPKGKATVPDLEAEMERLYEVAKLADMEEVVVHFEGLSRHHRTVEMVVPEDPG